MFLERATSAVTRRLRGAGRAALVGAIALAGMSDGAAVAGGDGTASAPNPFPAYFMTHGSSELQKDSHGIVMFPYAGVLEYNPVTIAQRALHDYNSWLSKGAEPSRVEFLKYADWLVANQTRDGLWLYEFAWAGQPVPWWSAMAEGQAISVLVRAASIGPSSKSDAYLEAAHKAVLTFTRPVAERGVTNADGSWFEEYLPPANPDVLNGMIFAMIGPREYGMETDDPLGLAIWNEGVRSVAANLSKYDSGSWSYYDCGGHVASDSYHTLHINLLKWLYDQTGVQAFDTYRARFEGYRHVSAHATASSSSSSR